ncbi:kinase-like domain-containing protein [Suillus clintonianus]|uniref:kinase-like domain-containing protein n=1 Tax=Suillus clintonianus TaxID=1904413 RepID=UPI001B870654|nr:kinase-like domain-containing protein [Suillus clintonianus]KAG2126827.1 kinase-like domain-containing protein [Suillus clintonianus]
MVSPWFENGSLAAYLQKHEDITLSVRLRLLEDVTLGLDYLHGVPVVHGDLTPNNVLLNDDKRAILTDFGLSTMLGDITGSPYLQRSCAQAGVIRYSAPELLKESTRPDPRSDIYSFGCLTLKVLSGNEPWANIKSSTSIVIKMADGYTPQRPACGPILDAHWRLIKRCFSLPGARPSTRDILKFLKTELESEDQKVSVVNRPTECSNGEPMTSSKHKSTAKTASSLISGVHDKGASPTRRFSFDIIFRRNSVPSVDTSAVFAEDSLKMVPNFALPLGGLGDTFQCTLRNKAFKKEKIVAVKSIKVRDDDEGSIEEARKIILAEVQRWMSLCHDNLLPIYGTTTGFGSSLPCLVSPWMKNGSLTSYLSARNQTLPSATKFRLLSHVAAGLHFLHSNDIIHGNLSSNNVLIDDSHTALLADYGLSSVVSTCGELFQSYNCGALRWTAPELINDDDQEFGNVSSRDSDIYSFGCIMLHVLSGKTPYWWLDDVLRVVAARHKGVDPVRCGAEMHEGHLKFIQRCLSVSPTDRPTIDQIKGFIARLT